MAESHKEICMFELKYCPQCGTLLTEKYLENEGNIPYCENCGDFRFPMVPDFFHSSQHDLHERGEG